jgi:WXXGXW repeat (2 copies)
MRNMFVIRSVLFSVLLLAMSAVSFGQIGLSITIAPPVLPVYEQPICPGEGYLWTPGYWGYGDDGYFWVSGDWIQAPEVGFLWTPGYWGWGGNAYAFHEGYWGQTVGFYGGISYGFGYTGNGYEGGRWNNGQFEYNTSVNRVNTTIIRNTYNTTVVENNTRVSFNGGTGGVEARATPQQEAAARERHIAPVAAQTSHVQQARSNPELRASANHGNPPAAAVAKSESVNEHATPAEKEPAREPAKEAVAPKAEEKPVAARPAPTAHASDLAAHKTTAPNTGNAKTDQKYQKQQDTLAAKQTQDHQKLQQQQEKDHQQLNKTNASDAQKQQLEQRHQQQTQQLEQKHTTQTQNVQTRQQPAAQSKPAESHPAAEKPH